MKKMKKKIDERRAKYSFAKGGEIKFGKWTLFRFVRSESRLVATRFNCVNLRHSRKRDGTLGFRLFRVSHDFTFERKKEEKTERKRERKKKDRGEKLTDHCQGEKTGRRLYDTLHGLRREACTVFARGEREKRDRRAVERRTAG